MSPAREHTRVIREMEIKLRNRRVCASLMADGDLLFRFKILNRDRTIGRQSIRLTPQAVCAMYAQAVRLLRGEGWAPRRQGGGQPARQGDTMNDQTFLTASAQPGSAFPPVLDACCGPRGMWFNKHDPRCLYVDNRREYWRKVHPSGTRSANIDPDQIVDFIALPFPDATFWHVVFDPPHKKREAYNGGMLVLQYGILSGDWQEMLRKGFAECFRVLRPGGTLVFKWCELEIPVGDILALTPEQPMYGHKSGKRSQTHWIAFLKPNVGKGQEVTP